MEADAAGARVFQSADGRQFCIRDLLDVAIQHGLKLHDGLRPDGTRSCAIYASISPTRRWLL